MTLKDELRVPLTCPDCGIEFVKSIATLARAKKLSCPLCGASAKLEGDEVAGIAHALDALETVARRLGFRR
jgi:hypothetical protein